MTRRRFIIGIDGLNAAEEKEFRAFIGEYGAWWHWIGNMWLLTTKDEDISIAQIRDRIREINPTARVVVFETTQSLDWTASRTVNAKGKVMSEWLRSNWDAE